MKNNCVHYVSSKLPLGEPWKKKFAQWKPDVCPHISAGREYHNYTAGSAWPIIQDQFLGTPKPIGIFPSIGELNDGETKMDAETEAANAGNALYNEDNEDAKADAEDFEEEPMHKYNWKAELE